LSFAAKSASATPQALFSDSCIDCGDCEERCPYHLPIREIMDDAIPWYHEQLALQQA